MEKKSAAHRLLAIETSGKTFGLAAAAGEGPWLRGEIFLDVGLRHSQTLKDACVFLLGQCGWRKEELTALAVDVGPGSFTGLRVGIAFARALAQALNLPLAGIPSFEVIARGIGAKAPLAVLIDSIGDEVFAGFFEPGRAQPAAAYRTLALPELEKKLRARRETVLAGDGFLRHERALRAALGRRVTAAPSESHAPRAAALARLALERLDGRARHPWEKVAPFYLRPPVAVERLNYREQKDLKPRRPH